MMRRIRLRGVAPLALLGLLLGAVVLAGCGTHGYAAPLSTSAHVALSAPGSSQPAGSAALVPVYATRIVAYYHGQVIPVSGAAHPAELRQGSCGGPMLAALSDGVPAASTASAAAQSDPAGGMDIAVAPGANLYVVVLDHPNDPAAPVVACGHPLSGLQQYFDLYPPDIGSNGMARGMALTQPIIATQLDLTLSVAQSAGGMWSLRTGGCAGTVLASGSLAPGATHAKATVFKSMSGTSWWLSVAGASGPALCGQATR
jgi:hypothetical protein